MKNLFFRPAGRKPIAVLLPAKLPGLPRDFSVAGKVAAGSAAPLFNPVLPAIRPVLFIVG
jgi:hypothetical protein